MLTSVLTSGGYVCGKNDDKMWNKKREKSTRCDKKSFPHFIKTLYTAIPQVKITEKQPKQRAL
jgi:hypothetical protein